MLDIKVIRDNPELVQRAAEVKGFAISVEQILELDGKVRALTGQVDGLRAERSKLSKDVAGLTGEARAAGVARVRELKEMLPGLEKKLSVLKAELSDLLLRVPNIPREDVPLGRGEADNVEIRRWGTVREFGDWIRDHVELGEKLGLFDIPRGVKVAGARSYCLVGDGALLEMAICRFVVDYLAARGFKPVTAPVLVREAAMEGTGYFPLGREQAYAVGEDDLYLVGTSEVSLVALHGDEELGRKDLPLRYAGYSTCFRREAGTYGKDTRGLYRVHQFQKVEQVVFCAEEQAAGLYEELLANTEGILQALELPYRVAYACTGELGLGQIRKHEIETWMPSRGAYCETHSCSTLGDFQARRLNIRYRDETGKSRYAWTLNNTGIASPRILIPLLENHQKEDGSVTIPAVLQPYLGERTRLG